MTDRDKAWFAPKRYGYGSGRPVAWQGWALLSGYMLAIGLCVLLSRWDRDVGEPVALGLALVATLALVLVSRARTRGGWRWRWGDDDRG